MQLGEKSNQDNYLLFVDLVQWKKQWQGANRQPGLPFIKKTILILIFNIYRDQQVPRRHPDNVITFCSSDNVSGMSAIASDHLSTEITRLELRCYILVCLSASCTGFHLEAANTLCKFLNSCLPATLAHNSTLFMPSVSNFSLRKQHHETQLM